MAELKTVSDRSTEVDRSSESNRASQYGMSEIPDQSTSWITWTAEEQRAIADPSNALHCMAAAIIEWLGEDVVDTGFADDALGKLFPPESQAGGDAGIRPTTDWVMFRARRDISCEDGLTPEPAAETRRFAVYAKYAEDNTLLSCSHVEEIVAKLAANNTSKPITSTQQLSVLEFASGSPKLTSEATLDLDSLSGSELRFAAIVSLTQAAAAEGTVTALGRLLRVKALVNEAGISDAGDVQCLVLDKNPLPGKAGDADGIVLLLFSGDSL
jgi:hypothetical protein